MISPETRRKIILENYQFPQQQVKLSELEKISQENQEKIVTMTSEDEEVGCGDLINLLVIIRNQKIEQCFFSAEKSCLITVAFANLLSSYLVKRDVKTAYETIQELEKMLIGKEYKLNPESKLGVFDNINNFPHRIKCLQVVINS